MTDNVLSPPPLGISNEEAQMRFDALQAKLVNQWRLIGGFNTHEQTMVAVPSVSLDLSAPGTVLQMYEERMLFLLLLLRKPRARIIYLTSLPILQDIVDYYMSLLPGVIPSHARQRLHTVPVLDATSRPLTLKILERPRLIERIRNLIPNPDSAHLVPFNTTELERDLALRLGIPMYGADPKYLTFGTKTGGRRLFAEEGVLHPLGKEDMRTADDCIDAIRDLRARRPQMNRVIVKLNDAVSGEGNAEVDLVDIPGCGTPDQLKVLEDRFNEMCFELPEMTMERFLGELEERGGVVEERVVGEEVRSPSVQARITPLGTVEILSTHDQLLGGASGQSFLGARFPADAEYAVAIALEAEKVAQRLCREGVLGRFAVDFVVVRNSTGKWDPYAIEINLRKGGTTAPFLILEFLVQGTYDWEKAEFLAPSGQRKFYISDDHVESSALSTLTPDDVLDLTVRHGLHFDHSTQKGIVYQMLSAVTERGRVGFTAVGDSFEEAEGLWKKTRMHLEEEAMEAARDPGLPG
jgi:hypothetical protein